MRQPSWLFVFNSISTTNVRVLFTMVLATGTGIRHWFTGEAVDSNWLTFIIALATIDTAHFAAKRMTHKGNGTSSTYGEQDVELTTDIRELSQDKG